MKWSLIVVLAGICFIGCESGNYDKTEKEYLKTYILLNSLRSGSSFNTGCQSTINFNTLTSSSFGSTCGQCHSSGKAQESLLNVFDYTSVKSKVIPGDSSTSLLYTKITNGSMTIYATDEIRTIVKCWIDTGANP